MRRVSTLGKDSSSDTESSEERKDSKSEKSGKRSLSDSARAVMTIVVALVIIAAIGWGVKYMMQSIDASRAELARNTRAARAALADSIEKAHCFDCADLRRGTNAVLATDEWSGPYFVPDGHDYTNRVETAGGGAYQVRYETLTGKHECVTIPKYKGYHPTPLPKVRWIEYRSLEPYPLTMAVEVE